eukprot:153988-Chlamydomonas_euryale.AAC.5
MGQRRVRGPGADADGALWELRPGAGGRSVGQGGGRVEECGGGANVWSARLCERAGSRQRASDEKEVERRGRGQGLQRGLRRELGRGLGMRLGMWVKVAMTTWQSELADCVHIAPGATASAMRSLGQAA